jgi:hypothetical protein
MLTDEIGAPKISEETQREKHDGISPPETSHPSSHVELGGEVSLV